MSILSVPVPDDVPAPVDDPPEAVPFGVTVETSRGVTRVVVVGELDLATTPRLDSCLDELRAGGWERVELDYSGLTFLDSTGLHLTIRWAELARADGVALTIVPGPPAVQRVFELTATLATLPFADRAPEPGGG